MAELLADLRAYLLDHAPNKYELAKLVGTRIYTDAAPEDTTFPYVLLTEMSAVPYDQLGGQSHFDDTVVDGECWANKPSTANRVRSLLREALYGYRGML